MKNGNLMCKVCSHPRQHETINNLASSVMRSPKRRPNSLIPSLSDKVAKEQANHCPLS